MTAPKMRSREYEWELLKRKNDLDEDFRPQWERQCKNKEYSEMVVGFRFKLERMKSGLTQHEVASALGVSDGTIVAWEKGHNDISLRDAHRYIMLLQKIPHDRPEFDRPSLNSITVTPMGL